MSCPDCGESTFTRAHPDNGSTSRIHYSTFSQRCPSLAERGPRDVEDRRHDDRVVAVQTVLEDHGIHRYDVSIGDLADEIVAAVEALR
jgi:hypothetical protein